jgi:hypothetical protein
VLIILGSLVVLVAFVVMLIVADRVFGRDEFSYHRGYTFGSNVAHTTLEASNYSPQGACMLAEENDQVLLRLSGSDHTLNAHDFQQGCMAGLRARGDI